MGLSILTPPAAEPVSVAELREYARLDAAGEDDLLARFVSAARTAVESFTGLSLVTRNARFTDAWPHCGALMLPAWPLTVTEVRALTTEGVATTMAASQWRLRDDSRPAVVSVLSRPAGAATIEVRFTAGFGAPAEVPAALRLAVLSLAAQWYDTRGVEPDENETLPGAVRRLLSPWRGLRL